MLSRHSAASCFDPSADADFLQFNELVTTTYGQTIKIVGSIPSLGSWNTASAVALNAGSYTSSNPLWSVTISLAAGQTVSYKFINVASDGTVTWESDPNHTLTVAASCATATTVAGSWQS